MNFSGNLKRFRELAGLSQEVMAEELEVAQPTYQRWEAGKREPSFDHIKKLARTLGVAPADFFLDEGEERLPSVEDLEQMIADTQRELPFGVSFEDYPSAVASGLHERLKLFRAFGGLPHTMAEWSDGAKAARLPDATRLPALAGPRTPKSTADN